MLVTPSFYTFVQQLQELQHCNNIYYNSYNIVTTVTTLLQQLQQLQHCYNIVTTLLETYKNQPKGKSYNSYYIITTAKTLLQQLQQF